MRIMKLHQPHSLLGLILYTLTPIATAFCPSKLTPTFIHTTSPSTIKYPTILFQSSKNDESQKQPAEEEKPLTLLDLAFQDDPSLADIHIPFIDPLGNNFIDCRIHYTVSLDNIEYSIGTPHDHTVAICYTSDDGTDVFLSPDEPIMDELFRLASLQLVETYDQKLVLKRTPSVLTISGDLENYVNEGFKDAMAEDLDADDLTDAIIGDGSGEDDGYFEKTMRKWMGDAAYEEDDDDVELSDDLLKMFEGSMNNDEDIERWMKEIFLTDEEFDEEDVKFDKKDAIAERLLSFQHEGRNYSLVRMTQPAVILGREDPNIENRRILLTPEENKVITPRVERTFMEELNKIGALPSNESNADKIIDATVIKE